MNRTTDLLDELDATYGGEWRDAFEPKPHYTETWSWLMAQERERAWFQPISKCRRCKVMWAPTPYLCIKCRMERTPI